MKSERLIESEHLSGGNAKQEGVANVPGRASHGDFNRIFHGAISHKHLPEQRRSVRSRSFSFLSNSPFQFCIICVIKNEMSKSGFQSRLGRSVLKLVTCIRRT